MAEIIAAIDEVGANDLFDTAIGTIGTLSSSGADTLGPFGVGYAVSGSFVNGDVDLIAPDTVKIDHLRFNWNVDLTLSLDLSFLDFCLPQVCVDIPCVGQVCTPTICFSFPTISVTVPLSDFVEVSADLGLAFGLSGGVWKVEVVVQGVSQLQFGPATAGMLLVLGSAVSVAVLAIPILGLIAAPIVAAIFVGIGVAGLTGLLGPIISPFISGLRIPVYSRDQHFQVLPAAGPNDPAVFITIDDVRARVDSTDEDELVLTAEISP
ncbi:MAG: hypothetical protein ABIS47_06950 [Acidimicrobiales bacterium]